MKRHKVVFLIAILVLTFALWVVGLFLFAADIPAQFQDDGQNTDGIVVLTGGTDDNFVENTAEVGYSRRKRKTILFAGENFSDDNGSGLFSDAYLG